MEETLHILLIVCPLVFLAGIVDAVAGGGGLITLPAYLLAGLPPHGGSHKQMQFHLWHPAEHGALSASWLLSSPDGGAVGGVLAGRVMAGSHPEYVSG